MEELQALVEIQTQIPIQQTLQQEEANQRILQVMEIQQQVVILKKMKRLELIRMNYNFAK